MFQHEQHIELPKEEVHLWLARAESAPDHGFERRHGGLLTAEERLRGSRFHFERDRWCHLRSRVLVRLVLSRYALLDPALWRFEPGTYGKPQIAAGLPMAGRLRFNLTHSGGLVALAVAMDRDLGVDVEAIERPLADEIAQGHFAPDEADWLQSLPEAVRGERFTELWTLKESYLKAVGTGLSSPLDAVSFRFDGDRISAEHRLPARHAGAWSYWLLRPTPRHVLSLCAGTHDVPGARLVVRAGAQLLAGHRMRIERCSNAVQDVVTLLDDAGML